MQPIVRVHTNAMAGVDPVIMLTGPIPATEKVLTKSGLSLGDIGVFEVNEAFACVVGAWLKDTGADHGITNPNGGAIALGHPLGASGARIMTTLVHHMRRNNITIRVTNHVRRWRNGQCNYSGIVVARNSRNAIGIGTDSLVT